MIWLLTSSFLTRGFDWIPATENQDMWDVFQFRFISFNIICCFFRLVLDACQRTSQNSWKLLTYLLLLCTWNFSANHSLHMWLTRWQPRPWRTWRWDHSGPQGDGCPVDPCGDLGEWLWLSLAASTYNTKPPLAEYNALLGQWFQVDWHSPFCSKQKIHMTQVEWPFRAENSQH